MIKIINSEFSNEASRFKHSTGAILALLRYLRGQFKTKCFSTNIANLFKKQVSNIPLFIKIPLDCV